MLNRSGLPRALVSNRFLMESGPFSLAFIVWASSATLGLLPLLAPVLPAVAAPLVLLSLLALLRLSAVAVAPVLRPSFVFRVNN